MAGARIPVGVVGEDPRHRSALVRLLDEEPGVELDAVGESIPRFAVRRSRRDSVVLLDVNQPGARDAAAVTTLVRLGHRVLVVSGQSGRAQVLGAMDAGARGYLCRDAAAAEVRRAVQEIAAGRRYISPAAASFLLDAPAGRVRHPELTGREIEVLAKVAAGDRDQDIADALQIGVRTVRSYLDRVRDKTGLRRRGELTRYAIVRGYVTQSGPAEQLLPA